MENLTRLQTERASLEKAIRQLDEEAEAWLEELGYGDFDEEGGDTTGAVIERDRARAVREQLEEQLENVDKAIQRVQDGTYGICQTCGQEIPEERLEAIPNATKCVQCQANSR
jgi:DnaK suppressor protein